MLELGATLDGSSQVPGTRTLNAIDCGTLGEGGRRGVGGTYGPFCGEGTVRPAPTYTTGQYG